MWRRAEERRGSESGFGRKRRDLIITHQGLSARAFVSGLAGKEAVVVYWFRLGFSGNYRGDD